MMTASHLFEDFGEAPIQARESSDLGIEEVEDQKLQAFENGYQAGWDDAIRAQSDTGKHVSAGLAASLQDASFEYHEVRNTLKNAVHDIMSGVTKTLLPAIARESLGAHICEQVLAMAHTGLEHTIEVAVAPDSADAVRTVLHAGLEGPFEITTDPLLAPTQAFLRLGRDEREIHLEHMLDEISTTVTAFFETQKSEVKDG